MSTIEPDPLGRSLSVIVPVFDERSTVAEAGDGRKFAWRDGVRALSTLVRYRFGKLR